jgi:hypothetical protein
MFQAQPVPITETEHTVTIIKSTPVRLKRFRLTAGRQVPVLGHSKPLRARLTISQIGDVE